MGIAHKFYEYDGGIEGDEQHAGGGADDDLNKLLVVDPAFALPGYRLKVLGEKPILARMMTKWSHVLRVAFATSMEAFFSPSESPSPAAPCSMLRAARTACSRDRRNQWFTVHMSGTVLGVATEL